MAPQIWLPIVRQSQLGSSSVTGDAMAGDAASSELKAIATVAIAYFM
ncbi:hypothetical protein [Mycolicibacterium murale]|nr:hypothetical protein [Mycolicibacterium murale]MCV7186400.1 hypothetical protein [Mycolicibacterium murale]